MLFDGGGFSVVVLISPRLLSVLFSVFHVIHAITALENEVLRNPKPSLVDRSVLQLSADRLVPPDIYVDRGLLRARVGYGDVCEAGGTLRGRKSPSCDSPDSDMELVAEAKARIQELQKEAETLEEAYRNYQQRAVYSTISHTLPPTAHSPQHQHPSHRPKSPPKKRITHHSHTHSPRTSKVSHRPKSPQIIYTPPLASHDTRNTLPPAHPKVTFLEAEKSTVFAERSLQINTDPLFLRDGHPEDESPALPRRLSSTPHSYTRKKLQRETAEGTFKNALSGENTSKGLAAPSLFNCQEIKNEIDVSVLKLHILHILYIF